MKPSDMFPSYPKERITADRPIYVLRDHTGQVSGFFLGRLSAFGKDFDDSWCNIEECYGDPVCN